MKKLNTLLAAVLFSVVITYAQKNSSSQNLPNAYSESFAQMHYWDFSLANATDTSSIKDILSRQLHLTENDQLRVQSIKRSKSATHILFQQYYNGTEVFGGNAKVAVSNNNVLFRCLETLMNTSGNLGALPQSFNAESKLNEFQNINFLENKAVYLWNGNQVLPGWYAKFTHNENRSHEAAWWANGELYLLNDLDAYADTTIAVKVFDPDPISPINQVYGGIFIDDNDLNQSILDPLRVNGEVTATFEGGLFLLKNKYVEIKEFDNPTEPVETSATASFKFSRSHAGFEQVNAFYHITKFQEYLESLGFNVVNYAIEVDANGFGGQDNSAFSSTQKNLRFGIGGIDDAEDADVIIHEFGHAVSHSVAPSTNSGNERRCLDEAFGDYFAVSYKKDVMPFGENKVFNWDGNNGGWQGRTMNNPDGYNYKSINDFNNIYTYTTLWNDAVMDIWNQIGKEKTDILMLEMAYGFAANMSFSEAALLMIDADSAIYGGIHDMIIWRAFDERGILDWTDIAEANTTSKTPYLIKGNLVVGESSAWLDLQAANGKATLIDINGRKLQTYVLAQGENELSVQNLPNGMYILQIEIAGKYFAEKLVVGN